MTKSQFRKNTKVLKRDVSKLIDNRIEKLINSGCVDFDKYEDNYLLPKLFISAVGTEIHRQFMPFTDRDKKEVKNIELFI